MILITHHMDEAAQAQRVVVLHLADAHALQSLGGPGLKRPPPAALQQPARQYCRRANQRQRRRQPPPAPARVFVAFSHSLPLLYLFLRPFRRKAYYYS